MKTIIWDVDDVLNNLMEAWFEKAWLQEHSDIGIGFDKLTQNPPHKLLGVSFEEYLYSLDRFRLSPSYSALRPNPYILEWLEKNGHRFRHVALTATPLRTAHISAAWVIKYFGPWIRTFAFVPSPRKGADVPGYDASKLDYINWLGQGDLIVEDNPLILESLEHGGIKTLSIRQPWNPEGLPFPNALTKIEELLSL